MLSGSYEGGPWALYFVRHLNYWKMKSFLLKLNRVMIQSGEDKLVWVGARDGNFSDKRLYYELDMGGLLWILLIA